MSQLDKYLSEQQARRVRELEGHNSELREKLAGRGEVVEPIRASRANPVHTSALTADRQALLRRLAEAEERIRELETDVDAVLNSRSWKLLRLVGIAKR